MVEATLFETVAGTFLQTMLALIRDNLSSSTSFEMTKRLNGEIFFSS